MDNQKKENEEVIVLKQAEVNKTKPASSSTSSMPNKINVSGGPSMIIVLVISAIALTFLFCCCCWMSLYYSG